MWDRFGPIFAAEIKKRRSSHLRQHTQWRWHPDEVYVKTNAQIHYLWRAAEHPNVRVKDEMLSIAELWRRLAPEGAMVRLLL